MFPFRDHNPTRTPPIATYCLIFLNIAVFLAMLPLAGDEMAQWRIHSRYALIPALLPEGHLMGLLTHMFLHAGFLHLAGNMLFLWIFGDNLEDQLGRARFIGFYLAGGLGAALFQIGADPGSTIPMVGASGAIAGVMGGYLLLFPKARIDILLILIIFFKIFSLRAWIVLGIWFALQLLNGLATSPSEGGVAYWAHAGGFLTGLVLIYPFWRAKGGRRFWERTQGHPPHPDTHYRRSTIPLIKR